jgi:hypothetical protein
MNRHVIEEVICGILFVVCVVGLTMLPNIWR